MESVLIVQPQWYNKTDHASQQPPSDFSPQQHKAAKDKQSGKEVFLDCI